MEKLSEDAYSYYDQIITDYSKLGIVEIGFLDKYNLIVEIDLWYKKCIQFIEAKNTSYGEDIYRMRSNSHLLKSVLKTDVLMSKFSTLFKKTSLRRWNIPHYNDGAKMSLHLKRGFQKELPLMFKYLNRIEIFDEDLSLMYNFHCNMLKYIKIHFKNEDRKLSGRNLSGKKAFL